MNCNFISSSAILSSVTFLRRYRTDLYINKLITIFPEKLLLCLRCTKGACKSVPNSPVPNKCSELLLKKRRIPTSYTGTTHSQLLHGQAQAQLGTQIALSHHFCVCSFIPSYFESRNVCHCSPHSQMLERLSFAFALKENRELSPTQIFPEER